MPAILCFPVHCHSTSAPVLSKLLVLSKLAVISQQVLQVPKLMFTLSIRNSFSQRSWSWHIGIKKIIFFFFFFFYYSPKDMFIGLREERETSITCLLVHTPTRDWTCNLGVCPNREVNPMTVLVYGMTLQPTDAPGQAFRLFITNHC